MDRAKDELVRPPSSSRGYSKHRSISSRGACETCWICDGLHHFSVATNPCAFTSLTYHDLVTHSIGPALIQPSFPDVMK